MLFHNTLNSGRGLGMIPHVECGAKRRCARVNADIAVFGSCHRAERSFAERFPGFDWRWE